MACAVQTRRGFRAAPRRVHGSLNSCRPHCFCSCLCFFASRAWHASGSASAIACHPRLLMLDEPAAGLNQAEYLELAELIRKLNAEGTTIVLIEHVLPLLLSVSSRVMVLNSGAVVAEAPPDEIVRDEAVIAAYLGERGRSLANAQDR